MVAARVDNKRLPAFRLVSRNALIESLPSLSATANGWIGVATMMAPDSVQAAPYPDMKKKLLLSGLLVSLLVACRGLIE